MSDLRDAFGEANGLKAPDLWDRIERHASEQGQIEPTSAPPRPFRNGSRRAVTIAVAFALFLGAGVYLWNAFTTRGIGRIPAVEIPSHTPDRGFDVANYPDGLTQLPPPPQRIRCCSATTWTGRHLLIWGGYVYTGFGNEEAESQGLSFDASTSTWSTIPAAPIEPRSVPASAWTGRELLVWGGQQPAGPPYFGDGAAYDPTADSWRKLPPAPLSARVPLSAWTGQEWIVWGTAVRGDDRPVDGAAYDPQTNSWRTIADAPIGLADATAVWSGKEIIVVGAALDGANVPESPVAVGAAYSPTTNTWRRIADSPLDPNSNSVAWTGREVIGVDYNHVAVAYDPQTDEWRDLPSLPGVQCEGGLRFTVPAGPNVLASDCGSLVLFRTKVDEWQKIRGPAFSPLSAVPAKDASFLLVEGPGKTPEMFVFRSAR